jgi:hypothetical protein
MTNDRNAGARRRRPWWHPIVAAPAAVVLVAMLAPAEAGGTPPAGAAPPTGAAASAASIPPPRAAGTLRITGPMRDGARVRAAGLKWSPGQLPRGDRLLSFEVAYEWSSCARRSGSCRPGADRIVTPFAARSYVVGHNDVGRLLRLREVATEVVETNATTFSQGPHSAARAAQATATVAAYPADASPRTEFVNGTPERTTGSRSEYFSVGAPHYAPASGVPLVRYQIDQGPWHRMPAARVFYTGALALGRHQVRVRTSDRAGATTISFEWRVVPLPGPALCVARPHRACWYPPHLDAQGRPMRWDWQIGVVTPIERSGASAVDLYDIDGFLTTSAEVRQIHSTWPAATLSHPRAVCYLDVAWEEYRPDASPVGYGGRFPASTLGHVYFGFPQERWLDFRQLDALKPMLKQRVAMCAEKGFDAVEIDDIDSFDPPSTTGFHLTSGDAENFLAYTFNLIHEDGMTALWKNSPLLASWGVRYTDGAVVEECDVSHQCFASQFAGHTEAGLHCTSLTGASPCGWDVFTRDDTAEQPNGKWVGEAEYLQDHYVCAPTASCRSPRRSPFATFCHTVYAPSDGFSAVLFTVDLNARVFLPCPSGV